MDHRMLSRSNIFRAGLLIALSAAPTAAFAHPNIGPVHGFSQGFAHPLQGLDHIVAMVAVGMIAARRGGRALWALPCAFLTMMAFGGFLGMEGVKVPFVETGILLSLAVFGLAVMLRPKAPVIAAMAVTGLFALFHGHAHGSEMIAGASWTAYGLGFIFATALLHLIGIFAGLGVERAPSVGGSF
jgi:urease accessory protein